MPAALVAVCVARAKLGRLGGQALDVDDLEARLEVAFNAENLAELPLGYGLLAQALEAIGDSARAAQMRERAKLVSFERVAGLPKIQRAAYLACSERV